MRSCCSFTYFVLSIIFDCASVSDETDLKLSSYRLFQRVMLATGDQWLPLPTEMLSDPSRHKFNSVYRRKDPSVFVYYITVVAWFNRNLAARFLDAVPRDSWQRPCWTHECTKTRANGLLHENPVEGLLFSFPFCCVVRQIPAQDRHGSPGRLLPARIFDSSVVGMPLQVQDH